MMGMLIDRLVSASMYGAVLLLLALISSKFTDNDESKMRPIWVKIRNTNWKYVIAVEFSLLAGALFDLIIRTDIMPALKSGGFDLLWVIVQIFIGFGIAFPLSRWLERADYNPVEGFND